MVAKGYTWDHPAPVEGEKEDLGFVLEEIESGKIPYKGTKSLDLTRVLKNLSEGTRSQLVDLIGHFNLMADYCIGQIKDAKDDKKKQLLHYRRLDEEKDNETRDESNKEGSSDENKIDDIKESLEEDGLKELE